GHSCAAPATSERGSPRKTAPTTFTKQATASVPTSASAGAANAPTSHSRLDSDVAWRNRPRYTSSSLTNPLSGGSQQRATAPSVNASAVQGIARERPPSLSISRVPVACTTAPAERNSSALKSE